MLKTTYRKFSLNTRNLSRPVSLVTFHILCKLSPNDDHELDETSSLDRLVKFLMPSTMIRRLHPSMIKYWRKLASTTDLRPMRASSALNTPRINDIIQISTFTELDACGCDGVVVVDVEAVVSDDETICMHAMAVEKRTNEAKTN